MSGTRSEASVNVTLSEMADKDEDLHVSWEHVSPTPPVPVHLHEGEDDETVPLLSRKIAEKREGK